MKIIFQEIIGSTRTIFNYFKRVLIINEENTQYVF